MRQDYLVSNLRDRWERDLKTEEVVTENYSATISDVSNGNPVMNMLNCISENYEEDERIYIDKHGDKKLSSHRILILAQNSSVFDIWVVLHSLVKEVIELGIIKSDRELISLSFRCGFKITNTVEVPQYGKFTCKKSHIGFF